MKNQDIISRWLGYSLLIILISILGYQLWNKWRYCLKLKEGYVNNVPSNANDIMNTKDMMNTNDISTNNNYFDEMMKARVKQSINMKVENEKPRIRFIYSGYNEIYDYIISKSIYQTLHDLEKSINTKKNSKKLFSFESIPKLYVYVLEDQPSKIHIVFTKLKKSSNLINLFNKTLKQENIKNEKHNILEKQSSIDDNNIIVEDTTSSELNNEINIIKDLLIKHNLTNVIYDLEESRDDIKQLIVLLNNIDNNILDNLMLLPKDNKILNINEGIVKNESIIKTLTHDKNYLDSYNKINTGSKSFKHNFSNVLLGTSNFIFDEEKKEYLYHQESLTTKQEIINYLFQNNSLGIVISLDRIYTFEMNELNSNLIEIYFKISDKKGELSSKEILNKLSTRLDVELSEKFQLINEELNKEVNINNQQLQQNKMEVLDTIDSEEELVTENKEVLNKLGKNNNLEKKHNNFKPNLSFYYLHNKFQIVKVLIRPYESDLIM